jgi:deferrochelatase/peroxidase EfeB
MPQPEVLGRNGTYVVFRKLHTRVAAYRQYLRAQTSGRAEEEVLAAKFVGRWPSGAPLVLAPERDDPELGADPRRNNAFLYADDPRGLKCPLGAHARRTMQAEQGRPEPLVVQPLGGQTCVQLLGPQQVRLARAGGSQLRHVQSHLVLDASVVRP